MLFALIAIVIAQDYDDEEANGGSEFGGPDGDETGGFEGASQSDNFENFAASNQKLVKMIRKRR